MFARATLGIRQASQRKIHIHNKQQIKCANLLIFTDIETWVNPPNTTFTNTCQTLITEVGAVAIMVDTNTVVDVYQQTAKGMSDMPFGSRTIPTDHTPTDPLTFEYYGFDSKQCNKYMVDNDQERMKTEFKEWVLKVKRKFSYNNEIDLVQWSGNDSKYLALHSSDIFTTYRDARMIFRVWLDNSESNRIGDTKLLDAIVQLTGETNVFMPHRAFEDAVATAMVFVMIISEMDNDMA